MREALIASACAAFAEDGYEGASLKQIAAGASATTGAVYHHFPRGKEGLLDAVVDRVFDATRAAARGVTGGGSARLGARLEACLTVLATPLGRVVIAAGAHVLGTRWRLRWEALWADVLDLELAALGAAGLLGVSTEAARVAIRGLVGEAVYLGPGVRGEVLRDLLAALAP